MHKAIFMTIRKMYFKIIMKFIGGVININITYIVLLEIKESCIKITEIKIHIISTEYTVLT